MPQLGWELCKKKQEVMPRITKGHFPLIGMSILMAQAVLCTQGETGGGSVSQIKPITCGLTH